MLRLVRQITSIVYDSDGYMSMPRVIAVMLCLCVITSWIAAQFFGRAFDGFRELCALCGGALGAYGWKKSVEEKGKKD